MAATATTTHATSTGTSTSNEDNTLGLVAHILLIVTWWVGPLILWLIKKEQGGRTVENSKEALNFGITLTILYVGIWVLTFVVGIVTGGLGFILGIFAFVPFLLGLIFGIMGAMAANKGQVYRYPFALRLVK